jgi:hypothetical protein
MIGRTAAHYPINAKLGEGHGRGIALAIPNDRDVGCRPAQNPAIPIAVAVATNFERVLGVCSAKTPFKHRRLKSRS